VDGFRSSWVVMTQTWSRIIWAHWPVDPDLLATLLPPGLVPDTFDGAGWVGLVPFRMENLRLPGVLSGVTSVLGVRNFGEFNVRTYVKGPDGMTGVYFFTLDADNLLAVATARLAFGLSYRRATIRTTTAGHGTPGQPGWTSVRHCDGARAELVVIPDDKPGRPAAPGLEHFLVERYALYSQWHGRLLRGTLSHAPWQVRGAHLESVDTGTVTAAGFAVTGEPHLLVGEPAQVRIHPFRLVRPGPRTSAHSTSGAGSGHPQWASFPSPGAGSGSSPRIRQPDPNLATTPDRANAQAGSGVALAKTEHPKASPLTLGPV